MDEKQKVLDEITRIAELMALRTLEAESLGRAFERASWNRARYLVVARHIVETDKFECTFRTVDKTGFGYTATFTNDEITRVTSNVTKFAEWVAHWLTIVDADIEKRGGSRPKGYYEATGRPIRRSFLDPTLDIAAVIAEQKAIESIKETAREVQEK